MQGCTRAMRHQLTSTIDSVVDAVRSAQPLDRLCDVVCKTFSDMASAFTFCLSD
jgi:hypothetical protein